jgi:hypothetical protein
LKIFSGFNGSEKIFFFGLSLSLASEGEGAFRLLNATFVSAKEGRNFFGWFVFQISFSPDF